MEIKSLGLIASVGIASVTPQLKVSLSLTGEALCGTFSSHTATFTRSAIFKASSRMTVEIVVQFAEIYVEQNHGQVGGASGMPDPFMVHYLVECDVPPS